MVVRTLAGRLCGLSLPCCFPPCAFCTWELQLPCQTSGWPWALGGHESCALLSVMQRVPRAGPGVDGPSGFQVWLRSLGAPAPVGQCVWGGAVGSPALLWPHPDPLSLESLVLSHSLDLKPGRRMSVLGVQASPETSCPLCGGRTAFCFKTQETTFSLWLFPVGARGWDLH